MVAKKVMNKGAGGIKIFRRKLSCLTVPNFSQWNSFVLCFRKLPLAKKIKDKRGVSRLSVAKFLSYSAEKIVGENLCAVFQKVPGSDKTLWITRGGIKIFRRKVFVSLCRKVLQGNPFVLCFRKLPVAKKIMVEGCIKIFHRRTFISHCRTLS